MNDCILIHYGEISLKGKNQPRFRKQLMSNIKVSLKSIGIDWPVSQYRGYIFLEVKDKKLVDKAIRRLKGIFGITWFAPARRFRYDALDPDSITGITAVLKSELCSLAESIYQADKSFRVQVKRSDKRFPGNSVEMEREFGGSIHDNTSWKKVRLKNPDQTFHVAIQNGDIFIHSLKYKGASGLPINTSQKVLVMFSGGIDSPVAAYLAARRGCHVDFLHFTASHIKKEEIVDSKIGQLAAKISEYTMKSTLYVLPSTYFDLEVTGQPVPYELILFRRFMARTAEKLAGFKKLHALVTGDNLSQVASQTLTNIASTIRSVEIPILQPLLTFEKEEIIDIARQIGTYETSILPYKDCCSIFQKNPRTVSQHKVLSRIESQIFKDYERMIGRTLEDIFSVTYRHGKVFDK